MLNIDPTTFMCGVALLGLLLAAAFVGGSLFGKRHGAEALAEAKLWHEQALGQLSQVHAQISGLLNTSVQVHNHFVETVNNAGKSLQENLAHLKAALDHPLLKDAVAAATAAAAAAPATEAPATLVPAAKPAPVAAKPSLPSAGNTSQPAAA